VSADGVCWISHRRFTLQTIGRDFPDPFGDSAAADVDAALDASDAGMVGSGRRGVAATSSFVSDCVDRGIS